ncbi:malto-oligosyltrehalose synthase [Desertivirga arenae]|uniref:malto-oligosyltrehalose synthase n=1 Tax=Desertivirga arenae TaxID=2810309 RepID=UPI001A96DDAA|nr:malto-oligosyltrehalose synthase [Pedobacter sp. SYSU D00823]
MFNPISTYRFQFHKEFTFEAFEKIIPYLKDLGVGTVYASPVFQSTSGSTHGYDGLNPHKINPEIGSEEQLLSISQKLKNQNISWLQDIVPNHMAFDPNNEWLMDVLEKGKQSKYASFFDIGWESPVHGGKIMVPFLGSKLEEVIEKGELKIDYKNGRYGLAYYDSFYPLTPRSYQSILSQIKAPNQAIQQLLDQMQGLHQIEDAEIYSKEWNEFLLQLDSLKKNESSETAIAEAINAINHDAVRLKEITGEQVYELCHWQETDSQINFRRFFTVNGLICLNIQDKNVFDHFHQYIQKLTGQGVFNGLRIDHIDGLYNPTQYLEDLRKLSGEDTYIVVEKILEPGEDIPKRWPIQGNTGYDFLAIVNNLFTNTKAEKAFTKFYEKLIGDKTEIHQQIHDKKSYILYNHMQGELDNLLQLFLKSDLAKESELKSIDTQDLKKAIGEILIHCPVYRYYGNNLPLDEEEADALKAEIKKIKKSKPKLAESLELIADVLLKKPKDNNPAENQKALHFYQRLMQFSGPLMAKGVEDTLMYTYNRFVGHNEVGDAPEAFGITAEDFHERMKDRQENWPLSINATSTHDTKRGEDVRARLNVLTDIADEWLETIELWQYLNTHLKENHNPEVNDEYFIYQTLVGALPMPGQDEDNLKNRLQDYLEKALREAKDKSNWTTPNEEYENATKNFALSLLDTDKPFFRHLQNLQKKVVDFGIVNSLAQVLLKFTCPGVPDVYQGCELWDLSLVDPDNRRPVDYDKRQQWLSDLQSKTEDPEGNLKQLWQDRYSGKIKLWLTQVLYKERQASKDLFEQGEYVPLKVKGKYQDNVLAYARKHKQTWYIVAVPLHAATIAKEQERDLLEIKWKETRIVLPKNAPKDLENVFLKTKSKTENELFVKDLFAHLPFALLKLTKPENPRSAGILLHITSLPSNFGTGDFGPEARRFADTLATAKQKLWQILPLSPTAVGQGYSPYSAISSMAGHTLLISPEQLVEEGLLDSKDLKGIKLSSKEKANFKEAEKIKNGLFEKAFQNFRKGTYAELGTAFTEFCKAEAYWLDSYALYIALKLKNDGKPWYEWDRKYKLRDGAALAEFREKEEYLISKTQWLQFIFMKQWKELKQYCNNLNIRMFGDLPFYVSYDSSDVWANPEIFALDEEGKPLGVAGVPPDYFNEDGQLWGMPIFRWDVLKEQGYQWWIDRIRKNMELFDYLRLDHFRAFSSYWDVPANEETAKNGEWKPGPASDFFRALENKLGKLPFVAEDLGDIDQPVYDLRDEFEFPGMKVLQFAFGDNLPDSIDIPHNYGQNFLVYTGTHDNNTTVGWFHTEVDKDMKLRLTAYAGIEPEDSNIHKILGRLAYASVAKTVILPLQDVLGLGEKHRMNTPAVAENNWSWRLLPDQLKEKHVKRLQHWVEIFNRE